MVEVKDIKTIRDWHKSGINPSWILDRLHADAPEGSAVDLLAAAFEFSEEDRQIARDYCARRISAFDADKELLKAIGLYQGRHGPFALRDHEYRYDDQDLEIVRQKYREGLTPIDLFDYFLVHRLEKSLHQDKMNHFFEQAFYLGSGASDAFMEYFDRNCLPREEIDRRGAGLEIEDINIIMKAQIDEMRPEWDIHFYQRPIRYPTLEEINAFRRKFESGVNAGQLVKDILENRLIDPPGLYLLTETFMLAFQLPQYDAAEAWGWHLSVSTQPTNRGKANAWRSSLTRSMVKRRALWEGQYLQISKRRLTLDEEKELQADFLNGHSVLEIVDKIVTRPLVDPTLDALVMSALVDAFRISQETAWRVVARYRDTHADKDDNRVVEKAMHEIGRRILVWS